MKTILVNHIIQSVVDKGVKRSRDTKSMKDCADQWRAMMYEDMTYKEPASMFFDADTDGRLGGFFTTDQDSRQLGKTRRKTLGNILDYLQRIM